MTTAYRITAHGRARPPCSSDVLPTLSRSSKVTGQRFYVVPASNRMTAHWTALDGSGCTCLGYQRRGTCTHSIAARTLHDRQRRRRYPRAARPTPTCSRAARTAATSRTASTAAAPAAPVTASGSPAGRRARTERRKTGRGWRSRPVVRGMRGGA